MLQSPSHQVGHRIVHFIPGGTKLLSGFFPGEFARPMPQEVHM